MDSGRPGPDQRKEATHQLRSEAIPHSEACLGHVFRRRAAIVARSASKWIVGAVYEGVNELEYGAIPSFEAVMVHWNVAASTLS